MAPLLVRVPAPHQYPTQPSAPSPILLRTSLCGTVTGPSESHYAPCHTGQVLNPSGPAMDCPCMCGLCSHGLYSYGSQSYGAHVRTYGIYRYMVYSVLAYIVTPYGGMAYIGMMGSACDLGLGN